MKKTKQILSLFLSVCMIISCMVGISVTASAEPTETLLTTITAASQSTYTETTSGVVTVTHDNSSFFGEYGWWWRRAAGSVTVSANEGYTITKCVFRQASKTPITVSTAPFKLQFVYDDMEEVYLCGDFNGVTSIEVYGYASTPSTPSTYTITIPSTLTVNNSGWNELTGGISATGTLESGKKLTVSATSANGWALISGDNSVGYTLTTAEGGSQTTSWEFDSLSSTATTKSLGIIVENYDNKPAGTYTDTVTFTAKVEVAKAAAEKPDIEQADCTFSPSNGKSTLSNANITTSMEYSADNGTTWTDVTSNGS
ncbi:MAG: hypothetical protein IJ784_08190, partial [Ruminiclostridium sp.]|nr:hypothetical protein [Ruminiclostridium sp.]